MLRREYRCQDFEELLLEIFSFHGQEVFIDLERGIGEKKKLFRVVFPVVRWASHSRILNCAMLMAAILFHPDFRIPDQAKAIFQYGTSANNRRAFARLNECLDESVRMKISANGSRPSLFERLKAVLGLTALWQAAGVLVRLRHSRALPHTQGVIGLATQLFLSAHKFSNDLKVVCVASDHSPICQAMLRFARQNGIKTCYIQHAPVTHYFPPLEFDLSILSDRASIETYNLVAKRVGGGPPRNVRVLPPFKESCRQLKLQGPPYNVGVCLSFVPDLGRVATIIDQLHESGFVENIWLRRHPRCNQNMMPLIRNPKTVLRSKEEPASQYFEGIDIALVPSSGVAVESLHHGCPTFYAAGTDGLQYDYYGFVKEGIIPQFSVDILGRPQALMAFFDADWRQRFSKYDETIKKSLSEVRRTIRDAVDELVLV